MPRSTYRAALKTTLHFLGSCSRLDPADVTVRTTVMRALPIFLLLTAPAALAISVSGPTREIRALWVDAFHEGIRTPGEANRLVTEAKMAHINVLFVQVRRRGDALYRRSIDPPLDDPTYDPEFDALDYIVSLAHREGIQVHAWINATPVWHGMEPPRDPRHVFNRHGLSQAGAENWLTMNRNGEARFPAGYFLDPGHPAAAAYLAEVYLNIVRNYAVDGIHFDYIRYPETRERTLCGASVGYNPVSVERFQLATGRTDIPAPEDEQWMAWRREQVTQLVRRVYLEAKALNPRIQVSAAAVAWGRPPVKESDFLNATPGQQVFQDWHGWLKEGILDLAVPMNYARESDPSIRNWFDGWIRWEKRHKHGRQIAVGIGAYLNSREANLAQIARVLEADSGKRVDGVSFFSYANPFASRPETLDTATPGRVEEADATPRVLYLSAGTGSARAVFNQPASLPGSEQNLALARGGVAGTVVGADRSFIDGARIRLRRTGWWPFRRSVRTNSDGNGYFGFANLNPGKYEVLVEGVTPKRSVLDVDRGKISRVTLGE